MTLDAYIERIRVQVVSAPKSLRTPESVGRIVEEGLSVIRQDLVVARRFATAARRMARDLDAHSIGAASRLTGHVELLSGKAHLAVKHYEDAQAAFREHPDERAATAVAMLQALAYTGEYQRAFEVGEEALVTFERMGDRFRAARVRANLGNAFHRLDRLEEAQREYELALPVLLEHGSMGDLAVVSRNYAVCLMGLQDLDRAESVYRDAREAFVANDLKSLVLEVDLNMAYLLGRRGLIREALSAYRDLRGALPGELGFEIGHCYLDQADFMLESGLWSEAEYASEEAAAVFSRLRTQFEFGKAKLISAICSIRRGHLDEAKSKLNLASRRLFKEPNQNWHSFVYQAQGELHVARDETGKATECFERALEVGPTGDRRSLIESSLMDACLKERRFERVESILESKHDPARRAAFLHLQGESAKAEDFARTAVKEFDIRRNRFQTAQLRYGTAIAERIRLRYCFHSLNQPDERLGVVTRLKNQSLAEVVTSPEAVPADHPLRQLRSKWFAQAREQSLVSEAELEARWRELQSLDLDSKPLDEQLCRPEVDETFLEFFSDEGELFAFEVSHRGVREHRLGSVQDYERQGRALRFHLSRSTGEPARGLQEVLRWFGERLEPFIAAGTSRITIGRDPAIAEVPFHASLIGDQFLYESCSVFYSPSMTMWSSLRNRGPIRSDGALVVGHADERAPEIMAEVREVSRILGVEPTQPEMLEARIGHARYVHLAAHGMVREDRPIFSCMQLGSRDWSPFDVMLNPLDAELTTLSGCSTGVSVAGGTQDLQGLIEAFLAAGSRTVLASLWQVSDTPTRLWMEAFYAQLKLGIPAAYRAAMDATRKRYPHPAHWAPFAVFGDPQEKVYESKGLPS